MTNSSSSDPVVLALAVHESGLSDVTIEDVTKSLSLEDALNILTIALPELKSKLPSSVLDSEADKKGTLTFPKYVVKVHKKGINLSALLYSPQQRRPYYQKFKSSDEDNLSDFERFMDNLVETLGGEDSVNALFNALDIEVNVIKDSCKLIARDYLFPPLVCHVSLIKRKDTYGVDFIKYVTPLGGIGRQVASMQNYWVRETNGLVNIDNSWFGRVSLPNFFDNHSMCFGSIDSDDLVDYDAKGAIVLDQFIDCVYSSYFNTDLYHNAPVKFGFNDTTTSTRIILDAFMEVISKVVAFRQYRGVEECKSALCSHIQGLYPCNSNLLAHIIQRNYTTMSKEDEKRYYS